MQIAIMGASGFIGSALHSYLRAQGHSVRPFSRTPRDDRFYWNPRERQINPASLEGCDVVINLAGDRVVGRWTEQKMERIRESRLQSTRFLVETLQTLSASPKVFLSASAIGYYGNRGKEVLTEESHSGHGYLAEVCRLWEESAAQLTGVRIVHPRIGLVLGKEGGMLGRMLPAFRLGLGGKIGSGTQIMSWIALQDLLAAFLFLMTQENITGPVNLVAPHPVSNAVFTQTLGRILHRPTLLPLPTWLLTLLFGSGADIFTASQHVSSKKLQEAGFIFQLPHLEPALKSICA